MPRSAVPFFFLLLFAICNLPPRSVADEDKKSEAATPPRSIQEQLDELRQGQERLLKEVEELKQILQQRPVRSEVAIKPAAPAVSSVNVRGEPFRGDRSAKIALMEFSDFDCSFCGKYAREVYPRIDEEYVKTGKLRYFFRDLPGPGETNAFIKACAARCAGDQGKFWEMHDLLFSSQTTPMEALWPTAQGVGLDPETLKQCVSNDKYSQVIHRSVSAAKRMGIFGTPAFLIGTVSEDGDFIRVTKDLIGVQSYNDLKVVLDELIRNQAKQ